MNKPTTFTGEVKPTRNYQKHYNLKIGKITGFALDLSTSPYAVIDIDIHGNDEQKETIRNYFDDVIKSSDVKVVKSLSGGYHFYTLWDNSFKPTKDSYIEVYKFVDDDESNFSVDVFVPYKQESKSRCIMLPGSNAKNKLGEIGTYELIKDVKDDELITYSEFCQLLFDEVGVEIPQLETNKIDMDDIDDIMNDISIDDLLKLVDNDTNNHNMTKELFNALVKGINENVEIHNDGGTKTDIKLGIFPVYCALSACINADITTEDVNNALQYIYENANLTPKARTNWDLQIERFKSKDNVAIHPGLLYSIVKKFNTEYYNSTVKPIIKRQYNDKLIREFTTARYTISDYKREKNTFKTIDDYINNLVRCLAFVDNGKYIIKEKDFDRVKYNVINKDELANFINFDASVEIEETITEEMIEKAKKNHRKLPGQIGDVRIINESVNIFKLLRKNECQSRFKRFEKVDLIGDDENIFGLYRPPKPNDYYVKIEDKPELVHKFFTLIEDQLFDEHAKISWNHFINTNAYLLQQRKKSNVFFVKYSTTGNSGKNYIDNAFSKLYEGFTLNGITEQQMNEKHNGGMINMLYRAYDEFDNSEYQHKTINNVVKRLTNDKIAARAMCADTKQKNDYSIDVLNTNDAGVYGLLKGDRALLSRLCIIRLKERDIKKSEYFKDINVIDDISFGYSLYNYLMNVNLSEFIAQSKFNRYDLNETDIIAKQLLEIKRSLFDDFLDSIYDSFTLKKYKGVEVDVITCQDLLILYDSFMRKSKYKQSPTSIEKELMGKGFTKQQMRFEGGRPMVYYRSHIEKPDDEKCDGFDDDDDDFPVKDSI